MIRSIKNLKLSFIIWKLFPIFALDLVHNFTKKTSIRRKIINTKLAYEVAINEIFNKLKKIKGMSLTC